MAQPTIFSSVCKGVVVGGETKCLDKWGCEVPISEDPDKWRFTVFKVVTKERTIWSALPTWSGLTTWLLYNTHYGALDYITYNFVNIQFFFSYRQHTLNILYFQIIEKKIQFFEIFTWTSSLNPAMVKFKICIFSSYKKVMVLREN